MNWIRRNLKYLRLPAGLLLLGGGIFVAYWWFYKLVPMRHLADPSWRAAHSEKACWEEEQEKYRRVSASPDLCWGGDLIGYYGDKQWFLWLVAKMQGDDGFRVCGCTETALMFMSNHEEESWTEFIKQHGQQSQEEWICDGFKQRGVNVHLPPQTEDTLPLLELLGSRSWNTLMGGPQGTNAPKSVPDYIHYNAFRWLRDSGFNPTAFVVSNSAAFTSEVVRVGVMRFTGWNAAFHSSAGVGLLAFNKQAGKTVRGNPPITEIWMQAGAWSLAVIPTVLGSFLLFGKRKKKELLSAISEVKTANHAPDGVV